MDKKHFLEYNFQVKRKFGSKKMLKLIPFSSEMDRNVYTKISSKYVKCKMNQLEKLCSAPVCMSEMKQLKFQKGKEEILKLKRCAVNLKRLKTENGNVVKLKRILYL